MDPNYFFATLWSARISDILTSFEKKRLDSWLQTLIDANAALGNPSEGFLFCGKFHTLASNEQRVGLEKRLLHPNLYEEGKQYIQAVKKSYMENGQMQMSLRILIRPCSNIDDIRDVLPEAAVRLIPELAGLPRTREEAWTIRDKPIQLQNFKMLKELVEFHVANHLLF